MGISDYQEIAAGLMGMARARAEMRTDRNHRDLSGYLDYLPFLHWMLLALVTCLLVVLKQPQQANFGAAEVAQQFRTCAALAEDTSLPSHSLPYTIQTVLANN